MITQEDIDACYAMEKDIDAEFEKEESLGSAACHPYANLAPAAIKQEHDGMEIIDPIHSSLSQTQYGEQP